MTKLTLLKGIDINKTGASKECDICHYWYFLDKGVKLRLDVYNGCHDLLAMSMNFSNIAILALTVLIINALPTKLAKMKS